jgi:anti-sigma B factor antagonist
MDQIPALQLTTARLDRHRVAVVAGEIDIVTAPALAAFLARCLCDTAEAADAGDAGDLVLDLSGVSFMDGRGLTALLDADYLARDLGVRLRLTALPARVSWLLKVAGLDSQFSVVPAIPARH